MSSGYQKIELHSSYKLGKDYEIFEQEQKIVEKILSENGIDYTILLQEEHDLNESGKYMSAYFVLSVFVKVVDIEKVIKLFDEDGTLGYYVDLDNQVEIDGPLTEESIKVAEAAKVERMREYEEETKYELDSEEIDPIQSFDDDPIKNVSNSEPIKINLLDLFIIGCLVLTFIVIISIEISGMINFWKESNYEDMAGMVLLVVFELLIFIAILKCFIKKKGE